MSEITVFDLFAGAGGFGLGFEQAGFTILGSLEKDAWAVETLKANHPDTQILHADIRDYIRRDKVLSLFEGKNPDVLIGGPPCQGFSIAGPVKDAKDPRNSLFRYFSRWIEILRSKVFVMENVKGILTRRNVEGRKVIDIILEEFEKHGYSVQVWRLNAANYGVPQMRERVFIVGNQTDKPIDAPIATHGWEKNDAKPISVEEAICDLPKILAGQGKAKTIYSLKANSAFQKWARHDNDFVLNHVAMNHTERLTERFKRIQKGELLIDLSDELQVRKRSGNGEISTKTYNSNYRHLNPLNVSPTIPAHFYSTFIHPYLPRNITAREAARIQSFPDWYEFKGKRTQISSKLLKKQGRENEDYLSQYNQIGNAVPPLLAQAIATHIRIWINGHSGSLNSSDRKEAVLERELAFI